MNRHKHFIFHVILWLLIWATAWIFSGDQIGFVSENGLSLVFQILAIAVLIYYSAPKLLLKKKYILFTLASLLTIVVVTLVLTNITPSAIIGAGPLNGPPGPVPGLLEGPNSGMAPPMEMNRRPPSKFFVNLLLVAIAYVIATLVETFLFVQRKDEELIINKNEALQTELKLLKSQINPHFLFNALNNIYALSAIDSGRTQQSISYLSDMLRYVLYECDHEMVPLQKEVDYIKNYVKLFALKSSKSYPITTKFHIENPTINIAPMVLIPFVENALKHSNIEKITGTFVHIKLHADSNLIDFEIENSKPANNIIKDGVGGIGIENVKKRLAILYPNSHQLSINETSEAFKVNLKLKLHG
ncbi:sensor histidine kinase [Maribacter sp. MMG018]|uniref:sensor histidine kinase n=1 Tax=Maribacter sp. MMG018 TaxID=2822688 RepID=UPI001B35C81F|nr:sensor histidine kinase [Maribacter sp. MMG018]MBQ4915110.1 sensor histidine kinase [Maribacter sp. MMG018]